MIGPLDIHQHLLAHDVRHEIVRVRRAAHTASHLAEALGVASDRCVLAHLLVVTDENAVKPEPGAEQLVLMMAMAGTDAFSEQRIQSIETFLGDRGDRGGQGPRRGRRPARTRVTVTAAAPELISSRTDYLPSQLAPILLPPDVVVVAVDELAALGNDIVYTATGDGGTALALRACDLIDITRAGRLSRTGDARVIVLDTPTATRTSAGRAITVVPAEAGDSVRRAPRNRVPDATV
jgi:Cys-tRNA(Pro)/Cys-tRNA(Cys) deacylase